MSTHHKRDGSTFEYERITAFRIVRKEDGVVFWGEPWGQNGLIRWAEGVHSEFQLIRTGKYNVERIFEP